ncbi:hypothetical protein [Spiroplasma endosymbiont of Melieria omissa]|uniref:hypothetical protein n=1 Tax=Spiroplasma endosymbiont of Melieria omissa TaxID=3139324 RepID=UPI003CCB10F7
MEESDDDSLNDDSDEEFFDVFEELNSEDSLHNIDGDSSISKKYMYNCVTILGNKAILNKQNK